MDAKQKQPCKICNKWTNHKQTAMIDEEFGGHVNADAVMFPVCKDGCKLVCTSCTKSQQMPSSGQLYDLADALDVKTKQFSLYFRVSRTHKVQQLILLFVFVPKPILELIKNYWLTTDIMCQVCVPTHTQYVPKYTLGLNCITSGSKCVTSGSMCQTCIRTYYTKGFKINQILDVFDCEPEESIRRIETFYT